MQDKIKNLKVKAQISQASNRTYRLIDRTNLSRGGTVIAINISDRYFLVTAGHVISEKHEYEIVCRNENNIFKSINSFKSRHVDKDTDIGILEISYDKIDLINSWLNISDINNNFNQNIENNVVVIGYPGEYIINAQNEEISKNNFLSIRVCSSLSYISSTIQLKDWPTTNDLERQPSEQKDIFVHFDSNYEMFSSPSDTLEISPNNFLKYPEFSGMSGGGIWLLESEDTLIWEPTVKLIGIQHSVKKNQWIHGSSINCFLELIARKYPDVGI